jgi:hypothetical protein
MSSRYMRFMFSGLSALALAFAHPVSAQQVYVTTSSNLFGVLNMSLNQPNGANSATFTQVGALSGLEGSALLGMGYGTDGNIYALDDQGNYYQFNPHMAALTTIGNPVSTTDTGDTTVVEAISDNKGTMYAVYYNSNPNVTSYDLYKVDMTQPFSHPATLLGNFNVGTNMPSGLPALDGYIALDSANHIFVGVVPDTNQNPNAYDGLYMVTPQGNGTVTTAPVNGGAMDTGFDQLAGGFTINNTLYGFGGPASSMSNVVSLNTTTGAGTIQTPYSIGDGSLIYTGLVVAGVPEASSFMLLSLMLGTGVVGLRLRAKRGRVQAEG